MKNGTDLFAVLGVPRDATDEVIRKRFRELARKYHPDPNQDDKAKEERFKEIGEAYEVLQNPKRRERHRDELERTDRAKRREQEQAQARQARSPGEGAASAFGDAVRASSSAGGPPTKPPASPMPSPSSEPAYSSSPFAAASTEAIAFGGLLAAIGAGMSLLGTLWAATSFARMKGDGHHYGEALVFLLHVSAITVLPAIGAFWGAAFLAKRAGNHEFIGYLLEHSGYWMVVVGCGVVPPLFFAVIHWGVDFETWGGGPEGPPLWWWLIGPLFMCIGHTVYLLLNRSDANQPENGLLIPSGAVAGFLVCLPVIGLPSLHVSYETPAAASQASPRRSPPFVAYIGCGESAATPSASSCSPDSEIGAFFRSATDTYYRTCVRFPDGQKVCKPRREARAGELYVNRVHTHIEGPIRVSWSAGGQRVVRHVWRR
jgi:hypothetical protein